MYMYVKVLQGAVLIDAVLIFISFLADVLVSISVVCRTCVVCVCVCVCVCYFATFSVFHYTPNRA